MAQLAKADGLKVIASAGSDDKVKFLKDIGVGKTFWSIYLRSLGLKLVLDVAFNYKTTPTRDILKKEGPINLSVWTSGPVSSC